MDKATLLVVLGFIWTVVTTVLSFWPVFTTKTLPDWLREKRGKGGAVMTAPTRFAKVSLAVNLVMVLLLAFNAYLLYQRVEPTQGGVDALDWTDYKPTPVTGQIFINQVVTLDGYHYYGNTFRNVTLEYNGTTPVRFDRNEILDSVNLSSRSRSITVAMRLILGLAETAQKSGIPVGFKDLNK